MDDIYDDFSDRKYKLNLIQYYALYDPNGDQGVIQGLRYYPRDYNTVIPNNPALKSTINYYKPYTNPRVVLPKPRYKKKQASINKDENALNPYNTLNQPKILNNEYNNNINEGGNIEKNDEIHRTYKKSYYNDDGKENLS